MTSEHDHQSTRAARNQALFRDVNERLEGLAATFGYVASTVSFTCECADLGCIEPVELTIDEYEAVRREPTHFAVLAGHVYRPVEDVVSEHDRFVVVAKRDAGGEVAAATDPRTAAEPACCDTASAPPASSAMPDDEA